MATGISGGLFLYLQIGQKNGVLARMEYAVTTFYKFTQLPKQELLSVKEKLVSKARDLSIIGLVLVAEEGINATIAGSPESISVYKVFLESHFGELKYKNSVSHIKPFKRFKVKIKPEIVQLKRTDIRPRGSEVHVPPEEWDALMAQEDVLLIDVRNQYETKLGTFKGAIDPKTKHFSQFPEWLEKSGIAKEKKIGIYCTGEIRCEKAAVAMKEQGYENVYSLEGGILNYLEKRPHKNFEGECFVFDHRTAVGQDLRPSTRYTFCVSCGNGGDIEKNCIQCGASYHTCDECGGTSPISVCSKNCRYQYNYTKKQQENV
ncbi:MAG: hypothetical protein HYR90_01720 [Candidatus Andersenbacteria bacterium]|nr:hypothetical protein [Candidatus Andersenbacteria bacterium]